MSDRLDAGLSSPPCSHSLYAAGDASLAKTLKRGTGEAVGAGLDCAMGSGGLEAGDCLGGGHEQSMDPFQIPVKLARLKYFRTRGWPVCLCDTRAKTGRVQCANTVPPL